MMTEGREMTENESRDSGRFEDVLRVLLNSGYRPPEARPAFKQDLLTRMKAKQSEVVAARRRRLRIRTLVFSTVTAAAASVMLLLAIQPTPDTAPASAQPAPHVAGVSAKAVPAPLWNGTVAGTVEVKEASGSWSASSDVLSTSASVTLRTTDQQAGIDLAQGVRLVLEKGAQLDLNSGQIAVNHGLLRVQLREGAKPLTLAFAGHRMMLEAGSDVQVAIQDPTRFAPGGQPAPDVMVIAGTASVLGSDPKGTPASLLAGRRYQLHNYQAFDRLGGERLDDRGMDDQNRWLQPQLVRFLTTKK
ncbi:MAG: hypothetical protein ACYTGH_18160 [Planctomycetota bacterium]|jgi:hypothetical protein